VPEDPLALYERSLADGWGDGLPVLAPTEAAVRRVLRSTPYSVDDVVAALPPSGALATIELVAVNSTLAGCEPDALPVVIAALEGMSLPDFNLNGVVTTTSSVAPMVLLNGPTRDRLGIDYEVGCMGGAGGRGSSTIGRAVMLCLRNIGGQRVGVTSKSVFGQPARSAGLCFGEWEKRSPWPSFAEQRGFASRDEVVTVHASKGTFPMADTNTADPADLLALLARTVAFPMSNKFLTPSGGSGQVVLCVNPVWADRFASAFPSMEDVQAFLHEHAWQPVNVWPSSHHPVLEEKGRVDAQGRVRLTDRPDQFAVVVCGGLGSLHAVCLPSWGDSELQSVIPVRA
jgi:hypothetical protein